MTRAVLPNRRLCETFEIAFGGIGYTVTVGTYADGRVGELFLACHKSGSDLTALARDAAISASLALQHGCPLDTLARAMTRAEDGSAAGLAGAALDAILARGIAAGPQQPQGGTP